MKGNKGMVFVERKLVVNRKMVSLWYLEKDLQHKRKYKLASFVVCKIKKK